MKMNDTQMRRIIHHEAVDFSAQIAERCLKARELEESGQYEDAREQLGEVWQRIGERPDLSRLSPSVAAQLLLRAGTLSGWLGSSRQIAGAQEVAKNLITESIELFQQLREPAWADDARIDLAICYWREGALDEARVMLWDAGLRASDQPEVLARVLLNKSVVEISAQRFHAALEVLQEAWPLFKDSPNELALGRFHSQRGLAFCNVSVAESREDYADRALEEYAMASYYFEQCRHHRYLARVENNVGDLLYNLRRYGDALIHMDRAREILITLKDTGTVAQVNEARAKVFIALERYAEAEIAATGAVYTLEKGDEASLLAEALITHGVALARMGKDVHARRVLQRAAEVSERGGDSLRAAHGHLTMIEELGEQLLLSEFARHYEAADRLSGQSADAATLARLRGCARRCAESALSHDDRVGIDAMRIGGTLEQEVLRFEGELIRRALDKADGRITKAACILGTSHQGLTYMLKARHPNLLSARTPVMPRRRSIIKEEERKSRHARK